MDTLHLRHPVASSRTPVAGKGRNMIQLRDLMHEPMVTLQRSYGRSD